jgi:protein involved in polysaccharide export with SLBB domain
MMKSSRIIARRLSVALVFLAAGWLLAGCQTQPGTYVPVEGSTGTRTNAGTSAVFQIGDEVAIMFSPPELLQPHNENIKEDGTIKPPVIGPVTAVGKLPGQLENELQETYKKYFKGLNVTVLPRERYYYVSGEVRKSGGNLYLGVTDIVKAISSAGDFTEFAKKNRIRLTRANGKMEIIDYEKAIRDPQSNVPVYPGDSIHVPRKFW